MSRLRRPKRKLPSVRSPILVEGEIPFFFFYEFRVAAPRASAAR